MALSGYYAEKAPKGRPTRGRRAVRGDLPGIAPIKRQPARSGAGPCRVRGRRGGVGGLERRRASADGHSASMAPPSAIRAPIQIQMTSGLTITRKFAGGGLAA